MDGFTLVELLVTMVVLVILLLVVAPAFSDVIASQRVQTATSDIVTALLRTRSEAIKQNADATLSPIGTWTSGWTVAANGSTVDQHGGTTNIVIGNPPTTPAPSAVTYHRSGRVSGTAPKFEVSASSTSTKRCVTVSLSGQPVVAIGACT